jgi:hypothetical protein
VSVFLDYLALAMLLVSLTLMFYGFIYIHDLPYEAAKHRNHPQQDAIHVACWLSLFTLHAIWPIVFIWAVAHPDPHAVPTEAGPAPQPATSDLPERVRRLEEQLRAAQAVSPTHVVAQQAQKEVS